MDSELKLGAVIPLQTPLQKGMILAFKSRHLDLTSSHLEPTILQLWNEEDDVVLQISIHGGRNEVSFNAHKQISLMDGWGKQEKITNLASACQLASTPMFTISVHDCGSTYQILFNLTTVHFFHKRFSTNSMVTEVDYSQGSSDDQRAATTLSRSLRVSVYNLNSLSSEEQVAVQLGGVPNMTASAVESVVATGHAQLIASPTHPFAGLSRKWGKELRIYHLGPRNILQEHVYSTGNRNDDWYQGTLHNLGIVLKPDSALAAIEMLGNNIRVYYQVPESGFIQALLHRVSKNGPWFKGSFIAKAIKGSSIAAVLCMRFNGEAVHVYYQDTDLHIREHIWSPDLFRWVSGNFDAGAQPHGTQISAITNDDDPDIHVSWKDAEGRIVSRKRSKTAGISASTQGYGVGQLDGRD